MRGGAVRTALAALAVSACSSAVYAGGALAAGPDAGLTGEALARLMTGRFDNEAQAAADGRTRLHVIHERAASDTMQGVLIYAQLHTGGPDGPVYRQRIYQFAAAPDADGRLPMAVWTLHAPEAFADPGERPARLAGVTPGALERFDPGCDFYWTGGGALYRGAIADGDCRMDSRRTGRTLVITAEFTISAELFTHGEAGRYQDDGEYAFAPEGGVANHYVRASDPGEQGP
ncbi:MAG: hypothetical protein GC187_02985 [Alphaproteobacteria bacterium]|nr:hypothetical protein [Alphaproteobacteria bacterium]